ncbi:Kinetochore protein NDC80 -like protein [Trichinella pseudospiralis]|uniref:Kinetochore protein NDC80 n=1 Tax=Trichinella pseudospiralis TaxID=6337 RepID=A0A0V1IIQ5_TRIPS|nr:Kinetochore protein NDC80 -like protein [Trichinella pseudospiralis]KRZ22404.1 Kinetochore protein NDC80 -like protein [Trichinella pseudospiralis]
MDESNLRLYATPASNFQSSVLSSAIMKQEQSEDASSRVNIVYLENSLRKTTLEKDQRPLNDKQFVANMIKEVSAFLQNYIPGEIAKEKTLRNITKSTFTALIQFFVEAVIGCPTQINRFEEDVLRILKELEYPYMVKKSTLQTLSAPSSIPHIIGIFHWFVEEIKFYQMVNLDALISADSLKRNLFDVDKNTFCQVIQGRHCALDSFDDYLSCESIKGEYELLKEENKKLVEQTGIWADRLDDLLAKQDLANKLNNEIVEIEKEIEQSEQFFVALKQEHALANQRMEELKLLIESKHVEEQEAVIALDKRKQSFNTSQNLKTKTERVEQQIQIAKEQLSQLQNHRSGLTNKVILSQERLNRKCLEVWRMIENLKHRCHLTLEFFNKLHLSLHDSDLSTQLKFNAITVIRQDKMLMNNKQMELNDALAKTTLELKQVECLRNQTEKRLNEMQKKYHAKEMHVESERVRRAELIKQWFDEFEKLREYAESLENDNYEGQLLKLQEEESEINDSYNNSLNDYLLFLKKSNAKINSLFGWMSVWFQFLENFKEESISEKLRRII